MRGGANAPIAIPEGPHAGTRLVFAAGPRRTWANAGGSPQEGCHLAHERAHKGPYRPTRGLLGLSW
jgi:hypothetical protein